MTDSDAAAHAPEAPVPDAFQFTINVTLHNEHDPYRAIQWMVEHIVIGLQSGELAIRGVGPDGTVYLWSPERGKTPDDWLVNTSSPQRNARRHVPIPPGMTTGHALQVLARAAQEQPTTDADD